MRVYVYGILQTAPFLDYSINIAKFGCQVICPCPILLVGNGQSSICFTGKGPGLYLVQICMNTHLSRVTMYKEFHCNHQGHCKNFTFPPNDTDSQAKINMFF